MSGGLYLIGAAQVNIDAESPMVLTGNFENQSVRPDCFRWPSAALTMNGTGQTFEVAATDVVVMGFGGQVAGASQTEFETGAVTIAAGTSLTIENCRAYYAIISVDSSARVTLVGCSELLATPAVPPPQTESDASGINKTRFISFSVPTSAGNGKTALRVALNSPHHVAKPYTGGPSTPFTSFEGQVRWVGPPTQYVESSSNMTPFHASSLQCTPHYRDWGTVGLLHVTGSAIAPSSAYELEILC